jgi:C1A family cysteine protease
MKISHFSCIVWLIVCFLSSGQIKADDNPFRLLSKSSFQRIDVNIQTSHTDSIVLESSFPYVEGFSISGHIVQKEENSFVRILLEDDLGEYHVVLESSQLYNDVDTFFFDCYCEETHTLLNIKPSKLKIYVNSAQVSISEIQFIHGNQKVTRARTKKLYDAKHINKRRQMEDIVERINEYNYKHKAIWRADTTFLASLPWEKRKILLGIKNDWVDTGGIEYYAEGIFELRSRINGDEEKDSIWNSELTSTLFVDEFDWRDRHDKNWMTPVRKQYFTNACWAFSAVGVTEALVNLYYNRKIDLNLSEQELVSCSRSNTYSSMERGSSYNALKWIADNGIVDEDAFPFDSINYFVPCSDMGNDYTELVSFDSADKNLQMGTHPDTIKKHLLKYGPMSISYRMNGSDGHAVVLTGFSKLKLGDGVIVSTREGQVENTISNPNDPRIGKTYWICKNSYGTSSSNDGYIKLFLPGYDGGRGTYFIRTPITTLHYTNDSIACEDLDGDGFYNWGIGPKPAHCPSWVPNTPDGDDSDYEKGPMDEYGYLMDIPSAIPDSIIYITQNTVWTTRKYVYHDVYVNSGKTLRITNNINFYRGTKLYLASGSTLIVDGATLTDVSINYVGTTGTSIQILHNGTIKCVDNQDFVVPLGVNLDVNHGKIN